MRNALQRPVTRRESVMTASGLGLAALVAGPLVADDESKKPSAIRGTVEPKVKLTQELMEKLKAPSPQAGVRPAKGSHSVAPIKKLKSPQLISLPPNKVEGHLQEIRTAEGELVAIAATFVCSSKRLNIIQVNGVPLAIANFVNAGVSNILWKAGGGWPLYTTPCPVHDFNPGMRFPDNFIHSIVLGTVRRNNPGQILSVNDRCFEGGQYHFGDGWVFSMVNDNDYTDNTGTYTIQIYSWQ